MRERLGFLDGMKVIAAILVFHIHFFNAYYCGIYTLDPADFHTRHGIEWWIGATPLNLIYAGKVSARFFLAVSAFLLVWNHRQRREERKLLLTPLKKYLRLAAPVVVVNVLIFLLMRAGLYRNEQAAALAGSMEFFGVYNQFTPSLPGALTEGLWGCFLFGENSYNGPLWFLQYEFLGCSLLAAVLWLEKPFRGRALWCYRFFAYGILAVLLIRTDYLCMILAGCVAECYVLEQEYGERIQGYRFGRLLTGRAFSAVLLLCSLFLLTYPSYGNAEGTIYAWLPPKVLFYYNVALAGLLFAALHLKGVQKLFDKRLFQRFNRISYCFYLIHFPVLCTVSAAFFAALYGTWNYHLLALMTYLLAFLISCFAAWGLEKSVDEPMQKLARRVMGRLGG